MAYGENHDSVIGTAYQTVHAEEHAIKKLPRVQPKKKKPRVDILVIRTTSAGNLGISRPCLRCTILLYTELPSKGYELGNIYYTISDGSIVKTTIEELITEQKENPHISQYYRNRNMKKI
jgi:cytidine deaminase